MDKSFLNDLATEMFIDAVRTMAERRMMIENHKEGDHPFEKSVCEEFYKALVKVHDQAYDQGYYDGTGMWPKEMEPLA